MITEERTIKIVQPVEDAAEFELGKGLGMFRIIVDGQLAQMGRGCMKPGEGNPEHIHASEQMGYVLSGECELVVDGEKYIAKAGGTYYIPANKPHSWLNTSSEDFHYIDVFTPPRQDLSKGKFDTSLYTNK